MGHNFPSSKIPVIIENMKIILMDNSSIFFLKGGERCLKIM